MAFDNSFNIKIVTPNKVIDGIKAEKLTVLTKEGMISLLSHHVEYMTVLEISTIEILFNGETTHYTIGGGLLRFLENENTAILIVKSFCPVGEINIYELEKEKENLSQKIKNSNSEIEHKASELELKRAINRINAKKSFNK